MNKTPPSKQSTTRHLVVFYLWLKVWSHIISGLITLAFRFPFMGQKSRCRHIQAWSYELLDIFGIQLKLNEQHILPSTPFLLVSNHISWMDIHAINAFKPFRFVAKSEVAAWPIFGWMAKQLGTIFIRRENARHGKYVAAEVGQVLKHESVCIFPEGTSTLGQDVLPFKSNLFEAAIIADVPVIPLVISYKSSVTGTRSEAPAFVGEMGLLDSMANIFRAPDLTVELTFLQPSDVSLVAPRDRKLLALQAREAISRKLNGASS